MISGCVGITLGNPLGMKRHLERCQRYFA